MNWDGIDRRKFPRVAYPCLIKVRHEQDGLSALLTHTENIGIGGFCVILKNPIKLFTPIELEIDLLDTQDHVVCKGKVVWSVQRHSKEAKKPMFFDIGIEFVEMSDADLLRIKHILDHLAKAEEEPVKSRRSRK
jgi:hypothetical protein